MSGRYREKEIKNGKGGSMYYYLASPPTSLRVVDEGESWICRDVIGNYPRANPFDLSKISTWHPVLGGEEYSGSTKIRSFENYPIDYEPFPSDPRDSFPELDELDRSNLGWEILSRTNISAPTVPLLSFEAELPEAFGIGLNTFTKELKDIPQRVQVMGRTLLNRVAKGYITWRWAIRPMIHDLLAMANFINDVESRSREVERLLTWKSSRKRVGLGNEHFVTFDDDVFLHTTGPVIKAHRTVTHTSTMWGSVTYKVQDGFSLPSTYNEHRKFIENMVLGLNSSGALAALWEVTPWSWFIDWFAGIGTVINATNNQIPVTWDRVCGMRTTESNSRFDLIPGLWQDHYTISGVPIESWKRKERYLCAPVLPFIPSWQPLVTLKAWSILGSLYVLRNVPDGRVFRRVKPVRSRIRGSS